MIVSPLIPPGSIIRPPPPEAQANVEGEETSPEGTPFDHTSIIKTVQELFDLGPPLTARVAAAPSLLPALASGEPLNLGPERIAFVVARPTPEEVARLRKTDKADGLQFSMSGIAATVLGTIARVSAHFRHGARKTGHRVGMVRHRRRKPFRSGLPR